MKFICLLFFLTFISCKTFDYKDSSEKKYLGNPKKVEITYFDVINIDNSIQKSKFRFTEGFLFDSKKRIYFTYTLDEKKDSIGSIGKRFFDKKNYVITDILYDKNKENTKSIYKFNNLYRKILFETYFAGKLSHRRVFEYLDNKIDYIDYGYNKSNDLEDKFLISHNNKRICKAIGYDINNGSINVILEYKYDTKGRNYEQNSFDYKNKIKSSYKHKFDKRNNIIYSEGQNYLNNDTIKNITTINYKYDKKGNIIYKLYITNEKPEIIEEIKIIY